MYWMELSRAGARGGGGDRFIPLRLKGDEWDLPSEEDLRRSPYARRLAEALGLRRRVLRYNLNPTPGPPPFLREEREEQERRRPRLHSESILGTPDLDDAPLAGLLHWGDPALALTVRGVVYVALNSDLLEAVEIFSVDEATYGPLTSISWAPGGRRLAVASREVQFWDPYAERLLRTIRGCTVRETSTVNSMNWTDDGRLLTTGSTDSAICNIDLRARRPVINRYRRAHRGGEVCTLQWYAGVRLLSGEKDGTALVWDFRTSRSHLHRLRGHAGAVKAATWCPFDRNIFVTAGTGNPDSEGVSSAIKFWHFHDGSLMDSMATSSGVWGLEWDEDGRELISAMGAGTLLSWGFSSRKMVHVTEPGVLSSPIVHLTKSPNSAKLAAAQWDPSEPIVNIWGLRQQSRAMQKRQAPSACSLCVCVLCYILDALSIPLKQLQYYYEVVVTYFFSMLLFF